MKKLIIANWKMQLNFNESLVLAKKLNDKLKTSQNNIVICPDYLSLFPIASILKKGKIILGAQDSAIIDFGAYTGEISPFNLKNLGVKYVILGHSERREHLHENSAIINDKIKAALKNKLIPILCVGEKLIEKEAGEAKSVIADQLRRALAKIDLKTNSLIIAYEPIWAIGSGQTIIPLEAEEMHQFIKLQVKKILKKIVPVIYGGSVNSKNILSFMSQKNIDGFLVGGASLKADEFIKICLQ
ncbi:MAG: triose-phosphate isomerase [Patescibacteria group bacterium]